LQRKKDSRELNLTDISHFYLLSYADGHLFQQNIKSASKTQAFQLHFENILAVTIAKTRIRQLGFQNTCKSASKTQAFQLHLENILAVTIAKTRIRQLRFQNNCKPANPFRALKVKMWPLRCSENRQDNDSETGILKYGDAAGSSIGDLQ